MIFLSNLRIDLPHLFEKFYRVDNTETVGIVGSGLGLYISKSMVELMDGTIDVESTEWHGSRFIVTLPAVADSEEEQIVESRQFKMILKLYKTTIEICSF